jgi:hypothetical protein
MYPISAFLRPWPLTRTEIESFRGHALARQSNVGLVNDEPPAPVRRWRVSFTAPRST